VILQYVPPSGFPPAFDCAESERFQLAFARAAQLRLLNADVIWEMALESADTH